MPPFFECRPGAEPQRTEIRTMSDAPTAPARRPPAALPLPAPRGLLLAAALCLLAAFAPCAEAQSDYSPDVSAGGPVRLRQPTTSSGAVAAEPAVTRSEAERRADEANARRQERAEQTTERRTGGERLPVLPRLTEFEQLVRRITGDDPLQPIVRRFGHQLATTVRADDAVESANPLVPPEYLVKPGDEVLLSMWGSVDADLRLVVDRSGRLNIPRVGAVPVSGLRYAELGEAIRRRAALVFKNFELSATLSRLRGVRVFVTGFVERPGAVNTSSLSSVSHALLKAGGPSAAGSFRDVQLKRGGRTVAHIDFYKLFIDGDRSSDPLLEPDDVIHVGPVGAQAAIIGSVNQSAIFEMKPGEGLTELLHMAGGYSAVADRTRVAIERLDDRSGVRVSQIDLSRTPDTPISGGDIVRVFSAVAASLPVERQNKRVRVEGEVLRPGDFVLPPGSTINDALRAAGGTTPAAYYFGTEFTRESVRTTQQTNYERALRDLETDFARLAASQRATSAEEVAGQTAVAQSTSRLVERLRAVRPNGRIVLQIAPDARELPDLVLEDGDKIYIPPRPTTVGVFGSVFNAGSYLYGDSRTVESYLRLAGGPTKGADAASTFVIRANGTVLSERQSGGLFSRSELGNAAAQAGDTIYVPEEVNKTTFVQGAKDWTQILYQFGLGMAGLKQLGL